MQVVIGVDSLKAVEVRNWIFKELRCDVSVFDLLSPVPLSKLALRIVAHGALTRPDVASQALGEMQVEHSHYFVINDGRRVMHVSSLIIGKEVLPIMIRIMKDIIK